MAGLLLAFAVGAGLLVLTRGDSEPEPRPAQAGSLPVIVEPSRAPLDDPGTFIVPSSLSASRAEGAREALDFHIRALEARRQGDVPGFMHLAAESLRRYGEAGWIFRELGSLQHEFMARRVSAGDLGGAYKGLRAWLSRFPDSVDHRELLGLVCFKSHRMAEAAEHLEIVAEKEPRSLVMQRRLAQIYSTLGLRERGLGAVEKMLALLGFPSTRIWERPDAEETLRMALMVRHRFLDYESLAAVAAVLLDRDPDDTDALMAFGVSKRHLGEYAVAVTALESYLEKAAPDATNRGQVRLELGIAHLKLRQTRAALEQFAILLVLDPYDNKAYFQLGQCLVRLGRTEVAPGMYALANRLAPADREFRRETEYRKVGKPALATRHRAMGYALRGEYARGERILRSVERPGPGDMVYLVEYLIDLVKVQQARAVIERLQAVVGRTSSDVQGWTAEALILEGRVAEGIRILESLCRRDELTAIWGPRLGVHQLDGAGRPDAAVRTFERVLSFGPVPSVQMLLGRALFEAGGADRALRAIRVVPKRDVNWDQGDGDLLNARCLVKLGRDLDDSRAALFERESPRGLALRLGRVEWLEAARRAGRDVSVEDIARERSEVGRLSSLEARFLELRTRAALTTGAESAALLVEAARRRLEIGHRDAAVGWARRALASDDRNEAAWRLLLETLDRPEELFLRAEATRRLRNLGAPGVRSMNTAQIVGQLAGE